MLAPASATSMTSISNAALSGSSSQADAPADTTRNPAHDASRPVDVGRMAIVQSTPPTVARHQNPPVTGAPNANATR